MNKKLKNKELENKELKTGLIIVIIVILIQSICMVCVLLIDRNTKKPYNHIELPIIGPTVQKK